MGVSGMNDAAALVACRELGYEYGVLSQSPCGAYGGSSVCGALGSPIAVQDLTCSGEEISITECTWSDLAGADLGHEKDSVIFCGPSAATPEGSVRLLSVDGAPSLSGDGIAEVFQHDAWSPVCDISAGAAVVLCKALGFVGVATEAEQGRSVKFPGIGNLICLGSEASVLECNFESGEDVYCAPSEAAFIHCV